MLNVIKAVKKKMNGLVLNLVINGFILLLLGFLIVWTDFVLRLVMGLLAIVLAYVLFYAAYRIWSFKKDVEDYLKIIK